MSHMFYALYQHYKKKRNIGRDNFELFQRNVLSKVEIYLIV